MPQHYDAVLFDMDGLMIDTEQISCESWRRAGQELNIPVAEEMLLGLVGLAMGRCLDYASDYLGDREQARLLQQEGRRHYWQMLEQDEIPLKKGIEEVLDWVVSQPLPRAVATSTQRRLADIKLSRSGLARYFSHSVAGDEVARTKPDPDIYLAAAKLLGVAPQRCMVLEDSVYGLQAALAAGMPVILVPDLVIPPAAVSRQALAVCQDLHQALVVLQQH
ncbi:HAD family phosphatase [Neisseriaceae bacterium TC5R-5]|nr:HAD family phosphatase [Neisseriaceae bacterium TC5R-5]